MVYEHVPKELRDRPQWVNWRYEERGGKRTKVPRVPGADRNASAADPATWGTFGEAVSDEAASFDGVGVGFVFSADDPYVGVDLDHVRDGETGEMLPWAREVVAACASYAELSPSGTGVHVYVRGVLPDGAAHKRRVEGESAIEVYDRGRYFTVTGRKLAGVPGEVREPATPLAGILAKFCPPRAKVEAPALPPQPVDVDDGELIERARRASARFARLWDGDTSGNGGDHSAADMALCGALAFWTGRDAARVDRLFRASGLMRPKWDSPRNGTTYGTQTVNKACAECREVYAAPPPRVAPGPPAGDQEAGFSYAGAPICGGSDAPLVAPVSAMPASGYGWRQFKQRERRAREAALIADMLWKNVGGFFIALPKKFKSLVAIAMAVSLATGRRFAGRFEVPSPKRVAYFMEDTDGPQMIEDRVDAFLRGHDIDPDDPATLDLMNERFLVKPWNGFKLDDPAWRDVLEGVCRDWRADVVWLDVWRNMTGKDWNQSAEMGPLLDFLTGLHFRHGTTFILVHHEGYSAPGRPTGTVTLDGWWQQCISFARGDEPEVRLTVENKGRPTAHRRLALHAETRVETLGDGSTVEVPHRYRFSVVDEAKPPKRPKPQPAVEKAFGVLGDKGMTADEVSVAAGIHRRTAKVAMDRLVKSGRAEQCGTRKTGDRGAESAIYRRRP